MRIPPIASRRVSLWLLLAGAAVSCRAADAPPHRLDVIGSDYAFSVRDTVSAGPALVRFTSRGAVRHEMVLVRLRPETSPAEFVDSLAHDRSTRALRMPGSGVLFAAPHQAENDVLLSVTFERGQHYALLCQFRDSATAPAHQTLGMFKILTVR